VLGERKAHALRDALEGPVDPGCPASVLQTHPDVHVLADPAAAGLLTR
jgi:glucosamine-6-phosphate deaminase